MDSLIAKPSQADRYELRKQILAKREALPVCDRQQKSAKIITALVEHDSFVQAKTIFSYINFRSEVITDSLIETCGALNKRLCVPLTIHQEFRLVPYELTEGTHLRVGYCGIPEPDPTFHSQVPSHEIDLIILPGSVFDHFGGRLGYGGGFYDRFVVNEAPGSARIGLAFDLQLVTDKLPLLPHDQPLHYLITENKNFKFSE